jgi:hypothetical protein
MENPVVRFLLEAVPKVWRLYRHLDPNANWNVPADSASTLSSLRTRAA